jgi:hypothetical protein
MQLLGHDLKFNEFDVYHEGNYNPSLLAMLTNCKMVSTNTSNIGFIGGEITTFNKNNDSILVWKNGIFMVKGKDFNINADGISLDKISGTWDGSSVPLEFAFVVFKNVLKSVTFDDGSLIENGSILKSVLAQSVQDTLDSSTQFIDDTSAYSTVKSGIDSNGIYTVVQHKRPNGTLIEQSTLSGGIAPQYSTKTDIKYKADGVTVEYTKVYRLQFDQFGSVISETLI